MKRWGRETGTRALCLVVAVLCCLCANSISTFSLYGPALIKDLGYTQSRLNAISVTAEVAMYLPVPLWGYLCDRYFNASLAAFSGVLFGSGYILAAYTYRAGPPPDSTQGGNGWSFGFMVVAFVGIGGATMCLYLCSLAMCAKVFAIAKYRGLVMALPITAFGISGMWQAQVGVHLLRKPVLATEEFQLDVFRYFIFLGVLLMAMSLVGSFTYGSIVRMNGLRKGQVYGTIPPEISNDDVPHAQSYGTNDTIEALEDQTEEESRYLSSSGSTVNEESTYPANDPTRPLLSSKPNADVEPTEAHQIRSSSTMSFLTDRSMPLIAIGFMFLIGPCETYINNVGTIIPALKFSNDHKSGSGLEVMASLPESHVSIIALGSTFTRLLAGILSDLSIGKADSAAPNASATLRFSRMLILLPCVALLILGFLLLAVPQIVTLHPSWLLISSALVGVGYGAGFSLIPIIISVVWGLDNFATNWGIVAMMPVGGVGFWSWVYSVIYSESIKGDESAGQGQCRGYACYGYWAAGCASSVGITFVVWTTAWKIWSRRHTKI